MADKKKTGRKTIRADQELIDDLQLIATIDGNRSWNNQVVLILEKYRDRMKVDPKFSKALNNPNRHDNSPRKIK
jgi:hypothetical protein